ncbi:MAG: hypothetical protein AB7Q17_10885, partial [Phycisphaerae bacterium]
MGKTARFFPILLSVACGTAAAFAQQPAPAANPLEPLRTKAALVDEDRNVLRSWLTQRVTALASDDGSAAAGEMRTEYAGTPAFKEAFAAISIELIRGRLKAAGPPAAARMLAVIAAMGDAPADAASTLYLEALQDERPAVRAAAAAGLRNLRQRLVLAGAGAVTSAVHALRDAGKKETSASTLRLIYHALNYPDAAPNPPELKAISTAVLDLLEARAAQHDSGDVNASGADVVGLRVAAKLRPQLSDDEQKRYTGVLARVLRAGVLRYTTGEPRLGDVQDATASPLVLDERDRTEIRMEEAEK